VAEEVTGISLAEIEERLDVVAHKSARCWICSERKDVMCTPSLVGGRDVLGSYWHSS
jgi:hypothetical protein